MSGHCLNSKKTGYKRIELIQRDMGTSQFLENNLVRNAN